MLILSPPQRVTASLGAKLHVARQTFITQEGTTLSGSLTGKTISPRAWVLIEEPSELRHGIDVRTIQALHNERESRLTHSRRKLSEGRVKGIRIVEIHSDREMKREEIRFQPFRMELAIDQEKFLMLSQERRSAGAAKEGVSAIVQGNMRLQSRDVCAAIRRWRRLVDNDREIVSPPNDQAKDSKAKVLVQTYQPPTSDRSILRF